MASNCIWPTGRSDEAQGGSESGGEGIFVDLSYHSRLTPHPLLRSDTTGVLMAVILTIRETYSLQESAEPCRFITSRYLQSPSHREALVPILPMSR